MENAKNISGQFLNETMLSSISYSAKRNMKPDACVILGALVYFATVALNRFLGERNYRSLTPEEKLKLTDAFSMHRSLATYIPIGIFLVVIAVGYANPRTFAVAFPVGVVLVVTVSIVLQVVIFRRLKQISISGDYVRGFRMQAILIQIGSVVALALFAYGIVILAG